MPSSTRYPVPAATTRIEIRLVNSRFIATAGEAPSVDQAKQFIAAVRAEFPDATHTVFAYRIGYGASISEGLSDDGEPSGTAGRPALAVLRGADLGDVVVTITRYFGGTKLGKGGLVRAYTQATQEALAALPRTERVELKHGVLKVSYSLYERVRQIIHAHAGVIEEEAFSDSAKLSIAVAVDHIEGFELALADASAGKAKIDWG
jgi:uncharacterized YigZ family protein